MTELILHVKLNVHVFNPHLESFGLNHNFRDNGYRDVCLLLKIMESKKHFVNVPRKNKSIKR